MRGRAWVRWIVVLAVATGFAAETRAGDHGRVVVANRASGTVSVIDVRTDRVTKTVALPRAAGEPLPEPMYVVATPFPFRIWVGDRANDRVVAFNGRTFAVEATVPTGDGVWHMWADVLGRRLWVVNDNDRTATVIDGWRARVVGTVPMPEDLSDLGARPHDVVLDPLGLVAYVSFVGVPGADDAVVLFHGGTGEELNRAAVGKDPHLSFNWRNLEVYVACQNSNVVLVLGVPGLDVADAIPVPGAHGTATSIDGSLFYTTNLPGLGDDAVVSIDTRTNAILAVADAPHAVPHNLALTPSGRKLYLTHSGPNDKVSVYETGPDGGLVFLRSVTVGSNPFGLAFVP